MRIKIEKQNNIMVLVLDGDMMGGPDATLLSEKIHELIDAGQKRIVIDMSKVDRMNSSGLGILIGGLTTVRANGGEMRLTHMTSKVKELITITKLNSVFDNCRSLGNSGVRNIDCLIFSLYSGALDDSSESLAADRMP